MNGLIGYTGFVGAQLDSSGAYGARYRSTNIGEVAGKEFEHLVCAGVQAVKWWANKNPDEDWAGIEKLLKPLKEAKAKRVTLISSIDVYNPPREVDEDSEIECDGHHAYGLHRLKVEEWVKEHFDQVAILRLPGLFGPGLKKNVIYDMMHDNQLENVHPDGCFQYYDTRRLAGDISQCWEQGIDLLNLSSEPILTSEIRDRFFSGKELGGSGPAPAGYDMRSKYDKAWGGNSGYLFSKEQMFDDLGSFLESERDGGLA